MSERLLNLLSLSKQLPATKVATTVLGWRKEVPVYWTDWIARVEQWRDTFELLPGKNYALYIEDAIEFSAVLFAAWDAEKTIWLTADTLSSSIESLRNNVDGFIGEFPPEYHPIGVEQIAISLADANGRNAKNSAERFRLLDGQFIGLVVHTSGTTGTSLAIPKKLSQLASEIATLENLFNDRVAQAEVVATVSHQHIYGLLFKVLWPLCYQHPIHSFSQMFPEELASLIAVRSCVLIASPAHLKRLPAHLNWRAEDGRLAAIFSSGGMLPVEVAESTRQLLGMTPIEIFGSSETGGIAWRQRTEADNETWKSMPNVQWRVSADEILEVNSPHLFTQEWLATSDCVQAISNVGFVLKGRRDRIVKIEEKRVSLESVEKALLNSPLVAEAKVIVCHSNSDQMQRQFLAAVIVLSEQGKHFFAENDKRAVNQVLKKLLSSVVEPVAIPRKWRYVDHFPSDSQGKVTQLLLQGLVDSEAVQDNMQQKVELAKPLAPDYRIVEQSDHHAIVEVSWPENCLYFSGHFTNFPVLAGVVQVDWVMILGKKIFTLPSNFCSIHALKFQHVILPKQLVVLKLDFDSHKKSLNFSYSSQVQQHSSGKILFKD